MRVTDGPRPIVRPNVYALDSIRNLEDKAKGTPFNSLAQSARRSPSFSSCSCYLRLVSPHWRRVTRSRPRSSSTEFKIQHTLSCSWLASTLTAWRAYQGSLAYLQQLRTGALQLTTLLTLTLLTDTSPNSQLRTGTRTAEHRSPNLGIYG